MAHFRKRKIRQKPRFKPFKRVKRGMVKSAEVVGRVNRKTASYVLGAVLVTIGAVIVLRVTTGLYSKIQNFEPEDAVLALGAELDKDQLGRTNMVLLGDGGHVRDGADLVDTIMVASIDYNKNAVSLMSFPRDYYLRYIEHKEYAKRKINEVYRDFKKELGEEDAYEAFQTVLGDLTNLDIHYYARVDFNAFVEVIDSLGGIDVDVQNAIYDPYYPNETDNGYTVFEVDAGPQEMTGETALKFVRSRKTTSDFDRAARQQQVLVAIREKALSKNVLTSPKTIKKLYQSIQSNLNTNLSIRELIELAAFAKDFDRSNLVMKVVHDDPTRDGGFLYTPERKYYNGQFVLVPDGNSLELIHRYADLIFNRSEVLSSPVQIEILNATKIPGIAREMAGELERFGLKVVNIDNLFDEEGNRKNVEKSFIRYNSWQFDEAGNVTTPHQSTLDALESFAKGEAVPNDALDESSKVDVSIVLGADYDE